jgi:histone H3/H4
MNPAPLRLVGPQQTPQLPQSSHGPRIKLLFPAGQPQQPTFIQRPGLHRLQSPQTSAIPGPSTSEAAAASIPPQQSSNKTPPNHLKYVDVSKLIEAKKKPPRNPKPKPRNLKKKKKKSKKPNPKQSKYISTDDMKMMVKKKLKKPLRKRAPILLSAAVKALTVNLLKNAAEKAKENGSNVVTVDHFEDAPLIVAQCT